MLRQPVIDLAPVDFFGNEYMRKNGQIRQPVQGPGRDRQIPVASLTLNENVRTTAGAKRTKGRGRRLVIDERAGNDFKLVRPANDVR